MYPLHELLAELKQYQWVNLSHVVHDQIPFYHTFSPLQEKVISSMERDLLTSSRKPHLEVWTIFQLTLTDSS